MYYSRENGLRVVHSQSAGGCARKPADAVVDQYTLSDGRVVTWNWTPNGSIYPLQSISPAPSPPASSTAITIPVAYQATDGSSTPIPGRMRVIVNGTPQGNPAKLFYALDNGPYTEVPLPLPYQYGGYYFEINGLAAGRYTVRIQDAAGPPNQATWPNAPITVGATPPPATCTLTVADVDSTPPSRIGANDGTVSGTFSNTNGSKLAYVELRQGSSMALHLPVDNVVNGVKQSLEGYRFTLPHVAPGAYHLYAGIDGCDFPQGTAEAPKVTVDPPDLNIGDQLTFVPWVQPRLAHAATALGPDGRPTLDLGAELRRQAGSAQPSSETLPAFKGEIYGPGDVLGLNEQAILTTMPHPNATGFSPLQLAAIDFKDEDLPWRFSLPATNGQPPLPWCFLLVLKDEDTTREFTALPLTGPLPSIEVHAGGPYPSADAGQRKYWAHVQLNATLGTPGATPPPLPKEKEITDFLNKILPTNPDLAYSRVLSPRRLEPSTRYQAFLLPAIEAGRRAGLGLAFDATHLVPALPSGPGTPPAQVFPVYYQWRFTTGISADFEDLVQTLYPFEGAADAPVPTLAVPTAQATYQLPLPTLLSSADTLPTLDPVPLPVASYLYGRLRPGFTGQRPASGRPLVAPPLYGRAYMVTPGLLDPALPTPETPDAGVAPSWKHQLNLDPRYRALAALGAQVVQENQEDYVSRAWDQVRDLLLANEKLRGAQYGLRASAGLRDQHLPLNITTTTTTTTTTGGGARLASLAAETDPSAEAVSAETSAEAETAQPATFRRLASSSAASPSAADNTAAAASPAPVLADYGLHLTALSLGRVRVSDDAIARATTPDGQPVPRLTAREAIRRSSTPAAAFSPAFRRLSKPFGKYQVAQAGRPLRPTQPEDPAAPTGATALQQPGTSLRQRDGLLRHLADGALTAAPERAERVRAYQFYDDTVDKYLKTNTSLPLGPVYSAAYAATPGVAARFGAAFGQFAVRQAHADGSKDIVGFRKLQYQRPPLDLDVLKADVVKGTDPAPVFQIKIKAAGPTLPTPADYPPGHYLGRDFNATDFYVGDFDEPAPGDFLGADFLATDFRVPVVGGSDGSDVPAQGEATPARFSRLALRDMAFSAAAADATAEEDALAAFSPTALTTTTTTTTTVTAAPRQTDAALPAIRQAKVFPVFKDPMGEQLRQRRPELFVPGLRDFPLGGVARLGASQAFVEAYMVGLNHALGSELSWRGFPVELRGTFFQQFWDVSEHLNHAVPLPTATTPTPLATAEQETALLDIKPLAEWVSAPLGDNAPAGSLAAATKPADRPLRLALRSELLRRYPTLAFGLQKPALPDPLAPNAPARPDPDLGQLVPPRQRLAVGPDMAVLSFGSLTRQQALDGNYFLLLMQRPGQPQFGLDDNLPKGTTDPATDPLSWNDLSWPYLQQLGFGPGTSLTFDPAGKPFAPSEAQDQTHLTDSARVAYALFQEPVLAAIPLRSWLS